MPKKKTKDLDGGLPSGIGAPATRALNGAGITKLEQVTKATEAELLRLHGVGPKAIRIIIAALRAEGLSLATSGDRKDARHRP